MNIALKEEHFRTKESSMGKAPLCMQITPKLISGTTWSLEHCWLGVTLIYKAV